jgi:hypothetical protein
MRRAALILLFPASIPMATTSPFVYENESATAARPDAIDALLDRPVGSAAPHASAAAPAPLFVCAECGRERDEPVGTCGHCAMRRAVKGQHVPLFFALVVSFAFLTKVFLMFLP